MMQPELGEMLVDRWKETTTSEAVFRIDASLDDRWKENDHQRGNA